jgi:amino acid transporter
MAVHVTSAGGFYAMIARGLGGSASGMAAMVAVLGYLTIQFALYGLLGAVVSDSLQAQFGINAPWWACAFVAMASVGWFGYRQIDFSAKVLAGFVIAEYLVVLALDGLILAKLGVAGVNLHSFTPATLAGGNPFIGMLFCFAAFIGFEATTIYSEEAKNPSRTIPIATYAALLLVGGFYSFSLWCLVLGAGGDKVVDTINALGEPTRFLYALSDKFAGSQLTTLLRCLFVVSIYAGLIAFHNSAARYLYSMGRDGLLPAFLGVTHPRHRSPHMASLLETALCAAVVLGFCLVHAEPVLTLFSWLSNLATICVLVLMIGTSVSVLLFFRGAPHGHGLARTVVLPVLAGLGLCAVLLLAVANFHVLTGASRGISYAILGLVPLSALAGWRAAHALRRRAPARFSRLGWDRQ